MGPAERPGNGCYVNRTVSVGRSYSGRTGCRAVGETRGESECKNRKKSKQSEGREQ